jgi:hypothetical protein
MAAGLTLLFFVFAGGAPRTAFAQDSGIAGDLERSASASPQEKLQYAADAVTEVRATVKDVEKLMDEARREADTDRVECLTLLVNQIRALAQVTEASQVAMKDELASGDTDRADHELRKIAVALSKTRQLNTEAVACGEESGLASGQTNVRVEGGVTGDDDETDPLGVDVLDQGYDPPQQSPFN